MMNENHDYFGLPYPSHLTQLPKVQKLFKDLLPEDSKIKFLEACKSICDRFNMFANEEDVSHFALRLLEVVGNHPEIVNSDKVLQDHVKALAAENASLPKDKQIDPMHIWFTGQEQREKVLTLTLDKVKV